MSNAPLLARFRQSALARRKRGIDYTKQLESAETITLVATVVSPVTGTPFVVSSILVDPGGKRLAFFTEGGEPGRTYSVEFTVTTSGTQRIIDIIEFEVW